MLLTHGLAQQLVATAHADAFFAALHSTQRTPVRALRAWAGRVAREYAEYLEYPIDIVIARHLPKPLSP